jgi:hypothetical protein
MRTVRRCIPSLLAPPVRSALAEEGGFAPQFSQDGREMFRVRGEQKMNQASECPGRCSNGREKEMLKDQSGSPIRLVDRGECPECGGEGHFGVRCAVCYTWTPDGDDLDFHHWDYESNDGILVCRECHDAIHSTEGAYPGSEGWVAEAAGNALARAIKLRVDDWSGCDLDEVFEWLNLPNSVEQELRETSYNDGSEPTQS